MKENEDVTDRIGGVVRVQCLWRCYAAESRSHCYATWCIHVQDSSSGGHGHHHAVHLARTLGRLGWRSGGPGARPRKAAGGLAAVGRSSRCTLLDGTAVAVALMCQTIVKRDHWRSMVKPWSKQTRPWSDQTTVGPWSNHGQIRPDHGQTRPEKAIVGPWSNQTKVKPWSNHGQTRSEKATVRPW